MAYRLSGVSDFSADSNAFNEQPLFGQKLGDAFSLSHLGLVVFHWADFSETCELLEKQMKGDETLSGDFVAMKERVHSLRQIPIWVQCGRKVRQFNLFDLYASYILNQGQERLDPHLPMDISFISGSGPFKNMAISECFNHQLYHDMVMVLLLEQKIPKRDFRIRVKAKLLVEYGENFEKGHLFQLEQMTGHGLLFSCDSEFYFKEWAGIKNMRVLINSEMMNDASKMSLDEMRHYFDQFPFNLMYSSRKEDAVTFNTVDVHSNSGFDYFLHKKVYLFLPFEKIEDSHQHAVGNLKMFINTAKSLVRKIATNL